MRKISLLLLFIFLSTTVFVHSRQIDAYFAPNGGFSSVNNERTFTLSDGKVIPGTLNNAVLDLIDKTPHNGKICIVMYNFNLPELEKKLYEVAAKKHITVKIILDNCASWTQPNIDRFLKNVKEVREKFPLDPYDVHVKLTTADIMEKHNRVRILQDGKKIRGTMHEKFGVFYDNKNGMPVHSFCGSSNISEDSDILYAENRIFFRDSQADSIQLANQFALLWDDWSVKAYGTCPPERTYEVEESDVRMLFNIQQKNQNTGVGYIRIDDAILDTIDKVNKKRGTIDVAMFSFTHRAIAEKLVKIAKNYGSVRIRILLDHSQLKSGPDRIGQMSEYLEEMKEKYRLNNMEIRYKWRANAYGWDFNAKRIDLSHFRSSLMHHKLLVVNRNLMINGSYNYSESAEIRNTENIQIFNRKFDLHGEVIDRFLAEYDLIWNNYLPNSDYALQKRKLATIKGPDGRLLSERIIETLSDYNSSKLRTTIEKQYKKKKNIMELYESSEIKGFGNFYKALYRLEKDKLILRNTTPAGRIHYQLAD